VDDFLPTICNWAGIDAADHIEHLDGCDITGYITNRQGFQRTGSLIFHYPHVYGYMPDRGYAPHSAIRFEQWKAIYFYDRQRWELYDVASDISETKERSQTNPEVLRLLAGKLIRQLKAMDAQYPIDKTTNQPVPPMMPMP
jgi:arylsulfatase A-like enzyme